MDGMKPINRFDLDFLQAFQKSNEAFEELRVDHIARGPARELAQMIRWRLKIRNCYIEIPPNMTPDLKLR
jgi:hypothetical protein